jgi:hypothetical protein
MTDAITLARQMVAIRGELDESLAEHERRVLESAEADRIARVAKASAYLSASGTVQERTAHVDLATADVQFAAKLSDGLERSALEAIRSKRQALSSLQSLAAALREETALARWEPRESASA